MAYRLGFAGLYFHVGCLLDCPDPRLKCVSIAAEAHSPGSLFHDPITNPEEKAQEKSLAHYPDWRAMLDGEDLDVVAVFDVDARKADIVCEALAWGKHVIVDKPLCTRLEDLDRIETALAQSSGSLALLLPFPQAPLMKRLREIIRGGTLGDILSIRSRRAYKQKLGKRPEWFFTKEYGGGILCEIGTHDFDLARFLTGLDAAQVSARAFNGKLPQYPTGEDYASAVFTLGAQTLYSLHIDRIAALNAPGDPSSMEILGTKGQIIIAPGFKDVQVTLDNRDDAPPVEDVSMDGYPALVAAWLDALDSGDRGQPFFAPQVLPSVRGVLSAQKSADEGGVRVAL